MGLQFCYFLKFRERLFTFLNDRFFEKTFCKMRLSCILIIENYKQNLAYFLLIFSLKIEKKSSNCYFKIIQTRSIEFINGSLKLNFLLWNLKLAPAKRKREMLQKNGIIEQLFLWTSSSSNRSVRARAILKLQLLSVIEIPSLFTAWQCAKIHASTIGYFRRAFASPNMGILFSKRKEITIGIRKV